MLRNRIENHLCVAEGLMFKTPTTSQLRSHGFVWVISLGGRVLVQWRARWRQPGNRGAVVDTPLESERLLQRLAPPRAAVNQQRASLWSRSQVISINIAHMSSGAASAHPSHFCWLWKIICCSGFPGLCVWFFLLGKLRSALQMPCLSSEHGGKSSGIRLPRGRVHRGAFCRRPGGCHGVVYFVANARRGGKKEGVVTFLLCAHVSSASEKATVTSASASSASSSYVVVA